MAKREHEARYHHIYKTWPLFFWRHCFKCGQDFRRMRGWRLLTGPYLNGVGRTLYVCGDCAATPGEAESVVEASRRAVARPPPPAPMPWPRGQRANKEK